MRNLAAALVAVFLWALPANAAICMNKDVMRVFLDERYAEYPIARGLVGDDVMMQLFLSERGTWSVIVTNTLGISCINSAGDSWQEIKPPEPEHPEY